MLFRRTLPSLADLEQALDLDQADTALEILERHPALAGLCDEDQQTPLHLLCSCRHASRRWPENEVVALAERLLQAAPSSAAASDVLGRKPLHLLAMSGCKPPVALITAVATAWAQGQPGALCASEEKLASKQDTRSTGARPRNARREALGACTCIGLHTLRLHCRGGQLITQHLLPVCLPKQTSLPWQCRPGSAAPVLSASRLHPMQLLRLGGPRCMC